MTIFLIKAVQLMLSLSILVFIHELGHFMWAKIFKTRVDKFYLFFNPSFSLMRFKRINGKFQFKFLAKNDEEYLIEKKDAEGRVVMHKGRPVYLPGDLSLLSDEDWRKYPDATEWGIGWLPLGGYCKINGMVDESMDEGTKNSEPKPYEYRSKKTWQRLLIITGGVVNNMIGAILILAALSYTFGSSYYKMSDAPIGYEYSKVAQKNGLQTGDIILETNEDSVTTVSDAISSIVIDGKHNLLVRRMGKETKVVLPEDFTQQMLASQEKQLMEERLPIVIASVQKGSLAESLFEKGDSITTLNGAPYNNYANFTTYKTDHAGDSITLGFFRSGVYRTTTFQLPEAGDVIGFSVYSFDRYIPVYHENYAFWPSLVNGWDRSMSILSNYVKQFKLIASKEGAKSLGGFGAIGNLFPQMWNWQSFWEMTALLSVILAFMNILPIPVLDGGYVLFILYEIVSGKKPSDKFMEVSVTLGLVLLMALVVFANLNDVWRAIF